MPPMQLLTPTEAAAMLQVSTKTLTRLRSKGLAYVMLTGGTIRFRSDDLASFINNRTIQCHTVPKTRPTGTTTSRSGVVDFTEVAAQRTLKKRKR